MKDDKINLKSHCGPPMLLMCTPTCNDARTGQRKKYGLEIPAAQVLYLSIFDDIDEWNLDDVCTSMRREWGCEGKGTAKGSNLPEPKCMCSTTVQ